MKKYSHVVLIGVCILFFGGVCLYFYHSQILFERRLSCESLKDKIQMKLDKDTQDLNEVSSQIGIHNELFLLEIFYSEHLNTCLYTMDFQTHVSDEGKTLAKMMGKIAQDNEGYILRDALTNKNIFDTKIKKELEEKVNSLK